MDWAKIFIDATRAAVGVPAAAYALAAIGLNLHFGYTGLLNFGQVAFMMVGAYGVAVTVDLGGSYWLGVLAGMGGAVVLALIMGIPTLRLRTDYLAIVTIALAEILRFVFRSGGRDALTHGVFGIQRFALDFYSVNPIPRGRYGLGRLAFDERTLWVIVAGWSLVALFTVLVWMLTRAPWGRVLKAIREDEDAAASLGKNVFVYKLQSLCLGGVIGAFGGILLATNAQSVNPDDFVAIITFYAYTVLILGGPGTTFGPVVGAVIFWFLFDFVDGFLRGAVSAGWVSSSLLNSQDIAAYRLALAGLGLMLLMIFRPQGLFGKREEQLVGAR